jgi:hypothetical protein
MAKESPLLCPHLAAGFPSQSRVFACGRQHFNGPVQIVTGPHGSVVRKIDTAMPRRGGGKHLAARKMIRR